MPGGTMPPSDGLREEWRSVADRVSGRAEVDLQANVSDDNPMNGVHRTVAPAVVVQTCRIPVTGSAALQAFIMPE